MSPVDGAAVSASEPPTLRWRATAPSRVTRVEISAGGDVVFDALVAAGVAEYAVPPFVLEKALQGELRWRVVVLDAAGRQSGRSPWRRLVVR